MLVLQLLGLRVAAAAGASSEVAAGKLPHWTAPKPDGTPLQGYAKIANLTDHVIYRPDTEAEGRYNHAAMMMYHKSVITISWKNAPLSEDTPGQKVLFSQSTDGVTVRATQGRLSAIRVFL